MVLAPQITFRNMDPDERAEALILGQIDALERFFPNIQSCRVAVSAPVRQSVHYNVRIDLIVPGKELLVRNTPTLHDTLAGAEAAKKTKSGEIQQMHRKLARAIRDSFGEMRRRLQDHVRKLRGAVKQHEPPPVATVTRLFPGPGYGYLETEDGREIYFHRNAVLDGHFDQLRLGSVVQFAEEAGEKGPQASTVRVTHPEKQLPEAALQVPVTRVRRKPAAARTAKTKPKAVIASELGDAGPVRAQVHEFKTA